MQTIGLLGGMSWVSTQLYYREINRAVAQQLGGSHSAQCVLYSFDFAAIEELQKRGAWDEAGMLLGKAAARLREIGADFIVIGANTMHIVADDVERIGGLPVLHIADAIADSLHSAGVNKAALIGTRYTMEQPFLRERLERAGIDVVIPDDGDRTTIHDIIYAELIKDIVTEPSRKAYLDIIERLKERGAQAVILACTEIGLLIKPEDTDVPLFETASIHARAAAERAMRPSTSSG